MPRPDLFPMPEKPRKKREILMHVYDAGDSCDGETKMACCFECSRCGHKEEWMNMRTVTEAKRGIPCPKCNKPAGGEG